MSNIATVTRSPVVSSDNTSQESIMMHNTASIQEQMNQDSKYDSAYKREKDGFINMFSTEDYISLITSVLLGGIALMIRKK